MESLEVLQIHALIDFTQTQKTTRFLRDKFVKVLGGEPKKQVGSWHNSNSTFHNNSSKNWQFIAEGGWSPKGH